MQIFFVPRINDLNRADTLLQLSPGDGLMSFSRKTYVRTCYPVWFAHVCIEWIKILKFLIIPSLTDGMDGCSLGSGCLWWKMSPHPFSVSETTVWFLVTSSLYGYYEKDIILKFLWEIYEHDATKTGLGAFQVYM